MRSPALLFHSLTLFLLVSCGEEAPETQDANGRQDPRRIPYEIVGTTPHSTTASTQGLLLHEGLYYESTGGYGTSTLRKVDPKSGKVLK